jgi:adenine-specific DNA-methyltransferase
MERIKPDAFPAADRIATLKELFPEAFADGAIDWATLRDLASTLPAEDEEETSEHFGLFWPGKREARRLAGKPAEGTLIPCPGEGIDEDKTSNIFIEGENLEVLKLLRKSYKGMVKMIYIDPPYNTGNDFVYDDNFTEPLEDYLRRTGQIDGEGRPLTTNKKSEGRFHSKWLSMMYPRLRLARDLLRDDGVIFVSIDDNEVQHLRMLMNEVFGEECFICEFVWKSRISEDTRAKTGASIDHEYILCFRVNTEAKLRGAEKDLEKFSNPDSDIRGPWRSADLTGLAVKSARPNLHYDLVNPLTGINYGCPFKGWRFDQVTMKKKINENRILWPSDINGRPRHKLFLNEMESQFKNYSSLITSTNTSEGTKEIRALFNEQVFDFPKPSGLVKSLSEQITEKEDIVFDFFSGSATTAHAVLDLNKEDSGNRKFILVQMPEATPADSEAAKAGYKTIAEIGKERIRRVIKKIKAEKAQELSAADEAPDLGFKVFKLARSNFKPWKDYHGDDIAAIESLFENAVTPLTSGWKNQPDALFTEILLLEGYPLDSAVKARAEFGANRIREVSCPQHEKRLLVCLDDAISPETVRALTLRSDEIFVCLDSAIDDSTKARLDDKGMIKTI